jgi:hypothetical protein
MAEKQQPVTERDITGLKYFRRLLPLFEDELKGTGVKSEPPMNAIVFWLAAGGLYATNTWHLLWLPLVWIRFPGVLLSHGIALLFDIPAGAN